MKNLRITLLLLIITGVLLTGCNTIHYADLDDPGALEEPNENEIAYMAEVFDPAMVVETFDDNKLEPGFIKREMSPVEDGVLPLYANDSTVHQYISYENDKGFTSVTVCWKETNTKGHLILWATIPEFGRPTFINNPGGSSAHIHLDSLGGDTERLGWKKRSNKGIWITQEARIEGDIILLLRNGVVYFSYQMDKPRLFNRFTIGSNIGGRGAVDWIVVR
ncbi:MAG: hypothetical protein KAR21_03070 [Spirochaetales bacterium]|nr:hypothetical protein [Spirochaetales bacterium]